MKRKLSKITSGTHYHFSLGKKSQEGKQISCGDLPWEMLTSLFHLEVTQNTSDNFSTLSSGFYSVQKICKLLYF